MRRWAVLAVVLVATAQAGAAVNPATLGYCVAVSSHVAQQLRQAGHLEMADRLAGANARLETLLHSPEARFGFEQAFAAAAPERFPPQRIDAAIAQCSRAFAAPS